MSSFRQQQRRPFSVFLLPWLLLLLVLLLSFAISLTSATPNNNNEDMTAPHLDGRHLKITVVPDELGLVDATMNIDDDGDNEENSITYSGFLIDVLKAVSIRANFTYELLTPSGFGSECPGSPLTVGAVPYLARYRQDRKCATSDVMDSPTINNYTTDMYVGAFYVTPERELRNHFTIPLYPPTTGTQAMVGTATNIVDFDDFFNQQRLGLQGPACAVRDTAYLEFIRESFPRMKLVEVAPGTIYESLNGGSCDVFILGHSFAASFVFQMSMLNRCTTDEGKPIGIIGDPLGFGLNYLAFGIRKDLPIEFVTTLNYHLLKMMTCAPNSQECPTDSVVSMYAALAGTGRECGYVQFPPPPPPTIDTGLSGKVVVGIVVGAILLTIGISSLFYMYKWKRQEKRFRKRFVQQIARNISIGPSPSCISVEKLAEEVQHIGDENGTITKGELLRWMSDVKLEFISDRDFEALWAAMDPERKGIVNAIDFFVFLSACGDEFEQVYEEQAKMPKIERLKLASKRLSNINKLGEDGVRALQLRLERTSAGHLGADKTCQSRTSLVVGKHHLAGV